MISAEIDPAGQPYPASSSLAVKTEGQRPTALAPDPVSQGRPRLFTAVRRIAIDIRRAGSRTDEITEEKHIDTPDPTDRIEHAIVGLDVYVALATLSTLHRQVITEIYYNKHSVVETAHLLGIPAGTVKSRTYYAVRQLLRALAAVKETPPGAATPQRRSALMRQLAPQYLPAPCSPAATWAPAAACMATAA